MSPTVSELSERAKALSDLEKAELVDQLLGQLDIPDPRIEQAWEDEVGRRVQAAAEGRLPSYAYEEVMAKHLAP